MTTVGEAPTRLVVEADGGSRGNPGPAGYGSIVVDGSTGELLAERAGYLGIVSNNVAEYTGLLQGLIAAREISPDARIDVRMDSKLVVEQMSGRWQIKHEDMKRLAAQAREIFPMGQLNFTWIPRAQNGRADKLANEAMDTREPAIVRDFGPRFGAADPSGDTTAEAAPASEQLDIFGTHTEALQAQGPRPSGSSPRMHGPATTIIMVRHGETPMTIARQFSGSAVPGPGLADAGREQAAGIARLIARVGVDLWPDLPTATAVYASPMVRTAETAAIIADRLGLEVVAAPAFVEANFGDWEGLTYAEIAERWPAEYERWAASELNVTPPGGESMSDVGARVRDGLKAVAARHIGECIVVVTHVNPLRAAIGTAVGSPPSEWIRTRTSPAAAHILRFATNGDAEAVATNLPPTLG